MWFFVFKQKTAYEIMPSLVGSEMCIRDRDAGRSARCDCLRHGLLLVRGRRRFAGRPQLFECANILFGVYPALAVLTHGPRTANGWPAVRAVRARLAARLLFRFPPV